MKYVDEYRNQQAVDRLARQIKAITRQNWRIMEVCGGQTHSIVKYGIDQLLPESVTLLHGPGCPVCVTPVEIINQALLIASRPGVIFCSFGDMLRVPGSHGDLLQVKAGGGDVRIVYSPLDAVKVARDNPQAEVVFFAVGFETTAPANAMAVYQAKKLGLENFSILVSHVLVPPAMEAILGAPDNQVQGFLAAGHVCTIMGTHEYEPLAAKYKVPIVVTGFEPLDIMQGIWLCIEQLESKQSQVINQYSRSVRPEGNREATTLIREIFAIIPRKWRGIGEIPESGLGLTEAYRQFDAATRFEVSREKADESAECISGLVLQGKKKPDQCPAFGTTCTPENPLGATMVSNEGACAAYYRYRHRHQPVKPSPVS